VTYNNNGDLNLRSRLIVSSASLIERQTAWASAAAHL